jgi:hypothetical protein
MQIVISAIFVSVTGWLQAPPQTHAFSHLSYSTRNNNYDILDTNYRIKTEIVKMDAQTYHDNPRVIWLGG